MNEQKSLRGQVIEAETLISLDELCRHCTVRTEEVITLVLQVNGKVRDRIEVEAGIEEEAAVELAMASPRIQKHIEGKTVRKVIVVPGKLVNIVVS